MMLYINGKRVIPGSLMLFEEDNDEVTRLSSISEDLDKVEITH